MVLLLAEGAAGAEVKWKSASHFVLSWCIMAVYVAGPFRGPKGITEYVYFLLSGAKKASFSWSVVHTRIWWNPWHASALMKYKWPAESPRFSMASRQCGMGYS